MKVTHTRPGVYEGRIEPFGVEIVRHGDLWLVRLHIVRGKHTHTGSAKSLTRAKAFAARLWLQRRLNFFFEVVEDAGHRAEDFDEFGRLYRLAFDFKPGGVFVADWLTDHGYEKQLQSWIVRPGNAARVIWPEGWEAVAKAYPSS